MMTPDDDPVAAAVTVTPPTTPPPKNHDDPNNDQATPATATTFSLSSNPGETVTVSSNLNKTTKPPLAATTTTTTTPTTTTTSIQHYSNVDLSFGEWIADGGFCSIYEIVSIQDLDSGDCVLRGSPTTAATGAGGSTCPVNIPPKRDHNRGGSSAFGSFAGLVVGASASSSSSSAATHHKRRQSSPAGVLSTSLPSLPPALKTASLTVVSNPLVVAAAEEPPAAEDNINTHSNKQNGSDNPATTTSSSKIPILRTSRTSSGSDRRKPPTHKWRRRSHGDLLPPHNMNTNVLKCLKPKTIQNPRVLSLGLKDMEIEIEILQKLLPHHHPHIVQLKAFGTMEVEQQQEQQQPSSSSFSQIFHIARQKSSTALLIDDNDSNNNFYPFVILDRLGETLEDKLTIWETKHLKHSSLVGKMITHRKHSKNTFYLEERLQVLCDLASALAFLHGRRIIYRDLKPDNIGFDRSKDQLKLMDFGLAKDLSYMRPTKHSGLYHLTGLTGSARYMAPEVARQDLYNETCDVYAFSIVMWQVMALETPYDKFNVEKMFQQVYDCPHVRPPLDQWEEVEYQQRFGWLVLLLSHMWSPLIEDRPSMKHVHAKLKGQLEQLQIQQQLQLSQS